MDGGGVWCVVLGGGGGAVLLRPFQLFLQPLRAFDGFGQYVDVITSIPSNPISRGIFSVILYITSLIRS